MSHRARSILGVTSLGPIGIIFVAIHCCVVRIVSSASAAIRSSVLAPSYDHTENCKHGKQTNSSTTLGMCFEGGRGIVMCVFANLPIICNGFFLKHSGSIMLSGLKLIFGEHV